MRPHEPRFHDANRYAHASPSRRLPRPSAGRSGAGRGRCAHARSRSRVQSSCQTCDRPSRRSPRPRVSRPDPAPQCPPGSRFAPLMTLYLTDNTPPAEIAAARASGFRARGEVLPRRRDDELRLGRHGDRARVPGAGSDAEARRRAVPARRGHGCRTWTCSIASASSSTRVAPDHARLSRAAHRPRARHDARGRAFRARRNDAHRRHDHAAALLLVAQRPVRRRHAAALLLPADPEARVASARAGRGGDVAAIRRFFLGTDSAPHARHAKEAACCGAGCYSAPIALALYAEAFDAAGALDKLPRFRERLRRGLLRPSAQRRNHHARARARPVPREYPFGDDTLVPVCAGETVAWRVA